MRMTQAARCRTRSKLTAKVPADSAQTPCSGTRYLARKAPPVEVRRTPLRRIGGSSLPTCTRGSSYLMRITPRRPKQWEATTRGIQQPTSSAPRARSEFEGASRAQRAMLQAPSTLTRECSRMSARSHALEAMLRAEANNRCHQSHQRILLATKAYWIRGRERRNRKEPAG